MFCQKNQKEKKLKIIILENAKKGSEVGGGILAGVAKHEIGFRVVKNK